jgi:hypothetical protein
VLVGRVVLVHLFEHATDVLVGLVVHAFLHHSHDGLSIGCIVRLKPPGVRVVGAWLCAAAQRLRVGRGTQFVQPPATPGQGPVSCWSVTPVIFVRPPGNVR